jgi:hypothetical protein
MPRIAISYRRADTGPIAGRIFDWLVDRYGEKSVFIDIEQIPFGTDFRSHIREVLLQTDVLIAVIGTGWLGRTDARHSRIQEEADPVRVEIETALERKIAIIPVLIDQATMPAKDELPSTFGDFAYLNAPAVSSGRDFRTHMERLMTAIDRMTGTGDSTDASSPEVPRAREIKGQGAYATAESRVQSWPVDAVRYLLVPFIVLLAVHYAVVNSLNLNVLYLRFACVVVPFTAGFALFWIGRRGASAVTVLALALGVFGTAAMSVSESLYSGDPMLPHTRFEWVDNLQFVATIVLSYIAGHLLARLSRGLMRLRLGKP